jgi:hypothetical protein
VRGAQGARNEVADYFKPSKYAGFLRTIRHHGRHVWYTDFKDMLAADDGDPKTMAPLHVANILWDKPDGGKETYGSMAPVTTTAYHARGGKGETLPGRARVSGGRSDIHF